MRIFRGIAFGLGALVALILIAVLVLWLLVNPNAYKSRIVAAVRTATGRELALPGDIKLSVFPWVALELGPASLSNPVGFPSGEFLSVRHVALRVRLLPLLHRNLQIGRIEIEQPEVHLQKNAAGRGNWEDFGQAGPAPASDAQAPTHTNSSIFQSLAGIVLTHGHVISDSVSLNDLDLDVGDLTQESSADGHGSRYRLAHFRVTGEVQPGGAAALPFQFSAESLDLDLGAQTLRAPALAAQLASATLTMNLQGVQILNRPTVTGTLTLQPVNLRQLLPQLGVNLSATRDPQVYARLSFTSDFQYDAQSLRLQNLVAQLDDSQLHGSAALKDLATKATDFNLTLDHIDLDRYRAPAASAPAVARPGAGPTALPSSPLKTLDVHGTFVIGAARFSGLRFSDVNLNLQAQGGLIQLPALQARMYDGVYAGTITYDVRGPVPQLQLNQQLTGVAMAPLLKDAADSQRLSGHGNATVNLSGHGLDSQALLQSLTGRIELNLADGAIEGADLGYEIGAAQALLQRQPLPAAGNTRRTKFDAFRMSALVTNGVATTDDLLIGTPYLRVSGQGSTNLVSKALDLRLKATILKAPPASQGVDLAPLTLAEIPVTVTGSADSPKVRPDLQGLMKSQLKQKAQDLLKGKLNDKLQSIFGTH